MHIPENWDDQGLISCSADHIIRVTRFAKVKKISDVEIAKPSEEDLYAYKDDFGPMEEFAKEHPLNTKHYKNKMQTKNDVTSYCFLGDLMFSGYGDGLICCWDIG